MHGADLLGFACFFREPRTARFSLSLRITFYVLYKNMICKTRFFCFSLFAIGARKKNGTASSINFPNMIRGVADDLCRKLPERP